MIKIGYANTTILIYGIKIEEDIAKKIYDSIGGEGFEEEIAKIIPESEIRKDPSFVHNDKQYYNDRFVPNLFSLNTDSRVHSLKYDEGFEHIFGLDIAQNGYGRDDDIANFIQDKSVAEKAKGIFDKYIIPFLNKNDLKDIEGRFWIINQIH